MPFGGPGSNDFKIDHDLIHIYTEMGTHVLLINAQNCAVNSSLSRAFRVLFAPRKTREIESQMCQQSAIKRPDEIYPVDRRLEKIS